MHTSDALSPAELGRKGAAAGKGRQVSLYEQAFAAIKERILAGAYAPGTVLSEEALSRELGMSRTPIRQALSDLVQQGLLDRLPWRGAVVPRIDLQKLLHILELQQCLLEWCAVRICTATDLPISDLETSVLRQREALTQGRLEETFQEARCMDAILMRLGGNLEMQRIMDNLSDLLVYAAAYAVQRHASMEAAVSEHEAIIAAIRSGDADRTLEAVRGHCEGARYRLLG